MAGGAVPWHTSFMFAAINEPVDPYWLNSPNVKGQCGL